MMDTINTIYFNGCSFTEGGGFEEGKYWVRDAYKKQYGFEYNSEKDVCYPTIVQKLLPNIKVINEAKSGSGADRIIRKAWEFIEKNKLEDLQKTIFIFEIPGAINRLDVFSNKYNKYLVGNVSYDNKGNIEDTQTTLNWIYGPQMDEEYRNKTREILKEYSEYFINPVVYDDNISRTFFGLFHFMIKNDIQFYVSGELHYFRHNYLFKKYLPTFMEKNILNLKINGVFHQNIVGYCGHTKTTIQDEVGLDVTHDGHPGFKGHKGWGEAIVEFLKEPKIYKQNII